MTHVTRRTRRTPPKSAISENTKIIIVTHRQCCQTLGLVLRLRVDFVLPLSQEQEQEEQEEEQPLTKIYQKGVY